ncbi:hypothetical protein HAX54_036361, partial [Datura stramonium]|nr:hypothetical protein [Datura stramonium]
MVRISGVVCGGFGFFGSDGGKRRDEGRGLEGDQVRVAGDGEEGGLVAAASGDGEKRRVRGEADCGYFPVAKGKGRRMVEGCGDVMVRVGSVQQLRRSY